MAKGTAKLHFQKSKRAIKDFESASKKNRTKDYKVLATANEAVFQNLMKTTKGTGRRLSRLNARTLENMARLQRQLEVAGRKDVSAYRKSQGDYNGMLAQRNATSITQLEKQVKRGQGDVAAGVQQGKAVAAAGDRLVNIAKAGAKEMSAAADYQMATALGSRTQQDAELAAQMRFELAQTRLQHQLRMKEMEKEQQHQLQQIRVAERQAEKGLGSNYQQVRTVADNLTSIASDLYTILQEPGVTPAMAAQQIISDNGYTDQATVDAIVTLARDLDRDTPGRGQAEMAADVMTAIIRNVPGWQDIGKGKKDTIRELVKQQYSALLTKKQMEAAKAEGPTYQTVPKPGYENLSAGMDYTPDGQLSDYVSAGPRNSTLIEKIDLNKVKSNPVFTFSEYDISNPEVLARMKSSVEDNIAVLRETGFPDAAIKAYLEGNLALLKKLSPKLAQQLEAARG